MNVRTHGPSMGLGMTMVWLAILLAVLAWSWIGAFDPGIWALEVVPVLVVVPLLAFTRQRFPLTPLVYWLILVHAIILMVGGHYTYARVPLGFGCKKRLISAATTTTASGTWPRGSSRPWWRAKSCFAKPR